ncbi:MAG: hypothetical protein CMH76_08395 [Nitrospinae bacterium]|nr:hypothetical protein [Nitrospinota bacterium]
MTIIKKFIKTCGKLAVEVISAVFLLINAAALLVLLAVRSGRLWRYHIIVVPSQSINFGNTVYVPDIMRRRHEGKAILFIIPWDKWSGPNPATGQGAL